VHEVLLIEQDSAQPRRSATDCAQEMAVPAPHIDERSESREVIGGKDHLFVAFR